MSDAFAIGFDVQLEFFVLLDDMLFDIFDVDARIFDGYCFLAARDFNRQAVGLNSLRRRFGRRRRWILRG